MITGDGLVGFVSELGSNYCTVTTVINADFTAAAMVSRTREVVVTEGSFELAAEGSLKVAYLETMRIWSLATGSSPAAEPIRRS